MFAVCSLSSSLRFIAIRVRKPRMTHRSLPEASQRICRRRNLLLNLLVNLLRGCLETIAQGERVENILSTGTNARKSELSSV